MPEERQTRDVPPSPCGAAPAKRMRPVHRDMVAPCNVACPVGADLEGTMELLRQGRLEEARDLLLRENPMPGVTGRVCDHPCQTACNRASFDEAVNLHAIERVLGEIEAGGIEIVRGSVTFVPVCNPLAYVHGRRMGDRNLNRRLQPTATPQDNEDRIAGVLCRWLAAHDVLLDLHSFRSPGRPFVLRGPADNRGELEPFAHAAAEARLAAHVGPHRIVDGWMDAYAAGVARRKARGRPAAGGPLRPEARRPILGARDATPDPARSPRRAAIRRASRRPRRA